MARAPLDLDDLVVVAQGLSLAALAWPGRRAVRLPPSLRAAASGALVAGAALAVAGARQHGGDLTPRVAPPDSLPLLTDGVYARTRNPIYAGLLMAGGGWAVLRGRPEPAMAWAALLTVLSVKARREERALLARFGAPYAVYRDRTPRFVPSPRGVRRTSWASPHDAAGATRG